MSINNVIVSSIDEMTDLFYSQLVLSRLQGMELTEKEVTGLDKLNDLAMDKFEESKQTLLMVGQQVSKLELQFAAAQLDPVG